MQQSQQKYKEEDLLTVPQFAAHVRMSPRWVYEQIEKGRSEGGIIAFRFGGRSGLRIPRTELVRLKAERQIVPGG
jgi:hypothetical protein